MDSAQSQGTVSSAGGYLTILHDLPTDAVLQVCATDQTPSEDQSTWPPEIQQLVQHYSTLFEPPSQVPPSRNCDHSIPLIPGATPMYSRPYRFSPTIKDEVERQVREMLQSGIIKKTQAPSLPQSCWSRKRMEVGDFVLIIESSTI